MNSGPAGHPLDGVVSLHAGLKSRRCRRNPGSSGHSVNAKQPERPPFQGGPSRCESGHGDHLRKLMVDG